MIGAVNYPIRGIKYTVYGSGIEIINWVYGSVNRCNQVLLKISSRHIRGQSDVTFANAIAENSVAGRGSVSNVIGVDEAH